MLKMCHLLMRIKLIIHSSLHSYIYRTILSRYVLWKSFLSKSENRKDLVNSIWSYIKWTWMLLVQIVECMVKFSINLLSLLMFHIWCWILMMLCVHFQDIIIILFLKCNIKWFCIWFVFNKVNYLFISRGVFIYNCEYIVLIVRWILFG